MTAIAAGVISLSQIRKRAGIEKGKGLAIGGLILGSLSFAGVLLEIFVVGPYMRNVVAPQIQKALGGPVPSPIVPPESALQTFFPYYLIIIVLAEALIAFLLIRQQPPAAELPEVMDQGGEIYMKALNGALTGRQFNVTDNMVIGRSSDCALQLSDSSVSRHHARLRFGAGRWFIQDMNSTGRIFVNDVQVSATALNNGDRIRIGSNEFEFRG